MQRRDFVLLVGTTALSARAQSEKKVVELKSVGAGSFEFPLAGKYEVQRQGAATIFDLVDGNRTITVGFLRKPAGGPLSRNEQLNQAESLLRRNWAKFAEAENGTVTSPFTRSDSRDGLALMSLATEYRTAGQTQFYLNFAATDGLELVSLTIEGLGAAAVAQREIGPFVRAFVYTPRSN